MTSLLSRLLALVSFVGGAVGWSIDAQTDVRTAIVAGLAFVVAAHAALEAVVHHNRTAAAAAIKIAASDAERAKANAAAAVTAGAGSDLASVFGDMLRHLPTAEPQEPSAAMPPLVTPAYSHPRPVPPLDVQS